MTPTARLLDHFQQVTKEHQHKPIRITCFVMGIVFLTTAILLFIFVSQVTLVLSILFGLAMMSFFVLWLMGRFYLSEAPFYQILMPHIVEQIQFEEFPTLLYQVKPDKNASLSESGLVPQYATKSVRASYTFLDDEGYPIHILDVHCYTQSNKSYVNHFNGYLVALSAVPIDPFQLRTSGNPPRLDIRYTRIKEEDRVRFYVEKDKDTRDGQSWVPSFLNLKEKLDAKHLFLSVKEQKMYLAIDLRKPQRALRNLDAKTYQAMYQNTVSLMHHLLNYKQTLS